MVNNIPLGPNAVSVEVVKVFNDQAYLWRPTADMFLIGDALSEKIAWPVLKVEVMPTPATEVTPTKCAGKKIASPSKPAKKKQWYVIDMKLNFFICLMIDVASLIDVGTCFCHLV